MREMETAHRFIQGEPWIPLLSNSDYDMLTLEEKLEVLKTLCNMALECPTIRACLDGRLEREIAEQKRLEIEAKVGETSMTAFDNGQGCFGERRQRREPDASKQQKRHSADLWSWKTWEGWRRTRISMPRLKIS